MRVTEESTGLGEGGLERVAHAAMVHGWGMKERRANTNLRMGKVASQAGLGRGSEASFTKVKKRRVVSWPRVMIRGAGGQGIDRRGL
jgi:hypothetical protein